ncbi:hypothetical protein F4779DRAFT_639450 [Xylariaceae sp. FL0662B]|nr:hypothetical protein F4779DRAFT_639450 [Xylariaceae sp. FL0662B]
MSTFYEFRMLNCLVRFGICSNGQQMLKAYEDFKTCKIDEAELGRLIRLSPNNRSALVDTMVKCAGIMTELPKESKHCMTIIKSCGEMINIADNPPKVLGFPSFMKLPSDVRYQIYDLYLGNGGFSTTVIPYPKQHTCPCAPHEPPAYSQFVKKNISLALTSKRLYNEVISCFYHRQTFHFSCACEMYHILKNNALMRQSIRYVKFHWCGPFSADGISQLSETKLDRLVVIISKNTSKHYTPRAEAFLKYFFSRKANQNFLGDALGIDELLALRGLVTVDVEHIAKRKADRRTDDERSSLAMMLKSRVIGPREDREDN